MNHDMTSMTFALIYLPCFVVCYDAHMDSKNIFRIVERRQKECSLVV